MAEAISKWVFPADLLGVFWSIFSFDGGKPRCLWGRRKCMLGNISVCSMALTDIKLGITKVVSTIYLKISKAAPLIEEPGSKIKASKTVYACADAHTKTGNKSQGVWKDNFILNRCKILKLVTRLIVVGRVFNNGGAANNKVLSFATVCPTCKWGGRWKRSPKKILESRPDPEGCYL